MHDDILPYTTKVKKDLHVSCNKYIDSHSSIKIISIYFCKHVHVCTRMWVAQPSILGW